MLPQSVHAMLAVVLNCIEEQTVVARENFLAACHTAMLLAGGADVHPDDLANAVIAAAGHFDTLGVCGGRVGQHGALVEEYRQGLNGLVHPLVPTRLQGVLREKLGAAMEALSIASRPRDTEV